MKIIDFWRKGNVVRFYLGRDDLEEWYGDDWDDAPYEHNAGLVYEDYIVGYRDVAFNFDDLVLEPSCDYSNNSIWAKDDMVARLVPCIIVVPKKYADYNEEFKYYIGVDGITKYYFGDKMEPTVYAVEKEKE